MVFLGNPGKDTFCFVIIPISHFLPFCLGLPQHQAKWKVGHEVQGPVKGNRWNLDTVLGLRRVFLVT